MFVPEPRITSRPLQPAQSEDEYDLHLAAVEWGLAESIIIETEEDIKSRVHWRDRVEPFQHQYHNLITYCRRLPVMLLADDVGMGKTISAGLILSELMIRKRISRALIVCPKILMQQWQQELRTKFGIDSVISSGVQLENAVRSNAEIVITTYHSIRDRIQHIPRGTFEFLILDEAHRVRNLYGTQKPPKMALSIREALERRLFPYVLMLTATPIHNRPADIYSLLDCLTVAKGHHHPLGTYPEFRQRFLLPGCGERRLRSEMLPILHDVLREYLVRTRRGDARLPFPRRVVQKYLARQTPEELTIQKLVSRYIHDINKLQQISVLQAMMSSPQALLRQIRNMIKKGSFPSEAWPRLRSIVRRCQNPAKLKALLALIQELRAASPRDWRVVVFTGRLATQEAIGRALSEAEIPYGFVRGNAERENALAINAFMSDPPRIHVLVSTDSGAEGVNLQAANILVNYDLPWNPMVLEQRIGRLQRLGSRHEQVVVWNLVIQDSIEEEIVARLLEKLQTISNAIGDIESILESLGMEGEGEGARSFEALIRDLVVEALRGGDVRAKERQILENIEKARQLIQANQDEIDRILGTWDASGARRGERLRLKRPMPSMSASDLVVRGLQKQGVVLTQEAEGVWLARYPNGSQRRILIPTDGSAVEEGHVNQSGDRNVTIYAPGSVPFEELVEALSQSSEQYLLDTRNKDSELAETLAKNWCAQYGFQFLRSTYTPTKTGIYGSVALRATASNGVDRYEKLIRARIGASEKEAAARKAGGAQLREKLNPGELLTKLEAETKRLIVEDPDIKTFCDFYHRREQDELVRAQGNVRLEHRIRADFQPAVVGECVGVKGCIVSRGALKIIFSLENYVYDIVFDVEPATGRILDTVEEDICQRTGRKVPRALLDRCAVSGKLVLRNLLARSAISDKKALPEYLGVCQVSGKTVLSSELARSSVSGITARKDLLMPSPISGRLGLQNEFDECQITGTKVLKDELIRSDLSGRLFRHDEKCVSSVSGKIGHRSEMIRCEVTGGWVVPSEAGKSEVSGKIVRLDLLGKSAKSGKTAWVGELKSCSATGRLLLPSEVEASAVSGKYFDRDLLQRSSVSGLPALPEEMVRCQETGSLLLPSEVAICQVSGKRVDKRLVAVSAVSGKTILRRYAAASVVSGQIALPEEMAYCYWLDGPVLKSEVAKCRLTGLTICKQFLNHDCELRPLREMLNGWSTDSQKLTKAIHWLRQQDAEFTTVDGMWGIRSPSRTVLAACVRRSILGIFGRRYAGLLIKLGNPHVLVGRSTWGRRHRGIWLPASGNSILFRILAFIGQVVQWGLTLAKSIVRNGTTGRGSSERSSAQTGASAPRRESAPSTTASREERTELKRP